MFALPAIVLMQTENETAQENTYFFTSLYNLNHKKPQKSILASTANTFTQPPSIEHAQTRSLLQSLLKADMVTINDMDF